MSIFDTTALAEAPEPADDIFKVTALNPNSDQANSRLNITADAGNQEQASRALQIGKDFGVDPAAVNGDFTNFERMHKIGQWQTAVGENPILLEYINSHPLAAQVSQDDWKGLNDFTDSLLKFNPNAIVEQFGKKFSESLFQAPPIGSWMDPGQALKYDQYGGWRILGAPLEVMAHGISAALEGIHGAAEEAEKQFGLGTGFARDIAGMAEHHVISGGVLPHMVPAPDVVGRLQFDSFIKSVEPYIAKGEPIPVGLSPVTDKLHIEQAKVDSDALMDALKAAAKTETREIAPALFEDNLAKKIVGDTEIGISADAIRALYGDKVPAADDGLLGWVPRLQEQLSAAEKTGGDVQVPLAKWLTYADPEMAKVLEEHIRARPGGLTPFEAKEGIEVYHGSPHEFEAFDIGKAGTGEGAQSYGFGHYFAENPEVARSYAKMGVQFVDEQGNKLPTGNQYKARILRRPEEFLDYDAPLEQQSPEIQTILRKLQDKTGTVIEGREGREIYDRIAEMLPEAQHLDAKGKGVLSSPANRDIMGPKISKFLAEQGIAGIKYLDQFSRDKAAVVKQAQEDIAKAQERIAAYESGAEVSRVGLSKEEHIAYQQGIVADAEKAIAATASETRNFVVFRDADIEVLERNGKALRDTREAAGLVPREPPPDLPMAARPQQLEMPEATRMEDRKPFERGMATGVPQVEYEHYLRLIEKQRKEDAEWIGARAMREARRRQTSEWKANAAEERKGVVEEFKARPDVSADTYFREGKYLGDDVSPKPKLDRAYLTPEQQEILPKGWQSDTGMRPDDLAPLFGYDTGKAMLDGLTTYHQARTNAHMRPMDFSRRLIDMEVDRRMEEKFGKLEDNILEEAKERVLAETTYDILHEETLMRATDAGLEFSITKDQFLASIREEFGKRVTTEINSARSLADAGKAMRQVELALKKGDFATAFQWKQRQYIAAVEAKEALAYEAARRQLDRTAEKFDKVQVKSVESSATDYIQQLLTQAGYDLKVSAADIRGNMQFRGAESLEKYVDSRKDMGWAPEVSQDLMDLGAKPLDSMTLEEFRDFKDAIDSLHHIGREERKIEIAGEKLEWDEFRKEILDNIRELPLRPRDKQGRWLYYLDAPLMRMEEMVKDLDLRAELGPLFRAVIEPMMLSKAKEFDMFTELSHYFRDVKGKFGKDWRKSLSDTIPNESIIDPHNMVPYDLTREHLIHIMLNWGNRSNIEKFTRGYASLLLGQKATKEQAAAFEVGVKQMIDQHATKQDWDFVDAMWHPFRKFQKESDVVARNVSGVAPKWIKAEPVDTPHGKYEGGYWPVKYDRLGSDLSVIEDREPPSTALFSKGFFSPTTAKGHLKERTGYIDAVDITSSIEQAAGTMQQAIHDISFRDAVMQVGKIFRDEGIRKEIRGRYGVEYESQMMPWLRRIANQFVGDEAAVRWYNDWLRRVRVNLIGHALPLNLKVILSPDIGTVNPAAWARFEANREANVALAMEKSHEIKHLVYNMDRDYREQLEQLVSRGQFDALQRAAVDWGFKPMMKVSQEFRMATFVDQFNKAKEAGRNDHEAATIADSYVRERHGAASVVDLPAIMSQGEGLKMLTMFYGYFNTMYNWQRQLPGNIRNREYKNFAINATGSVLVGAGFGAALFNNAKQDDSWFKIVGKALMLQPLQTVPIVRDAANYFLEGYSPRTPMAGLIGGFSAAYTALKDEFTKGQARKPIQTAANVVGLSTGLPMLQVGKTGQFLWDVQTGKQRPRNIFEWVRGLIHGEAQLKKGK